MPCARFAHRAQAITAQPCCSALGSALSFLPMFPPVVPANYSFKATVQSLSRKSRAFARRLNSSVMRQTLVIALLWLCVGCSSWTTYSRAAGGLTGAATCSDACWAPDKVEQGQPLCMSEQAALQLSECIASLESSRRSPLVGAEVARRQVQECMHTKGWSLIVTFIGVCD